MRHKEVNNQLKQMNETIKDLMLKIEEKDKREEALKESIKLKTKEYEKLEQEVKKLKAESKALERTKLLEDFINMKKAHLDKDVLGFQTDEFSNQNDKEKRKGKVVTEKKPGDVSKT